MTLLFLFYLLPSIIITVIPLIQNLFSPKMSLPTELQYIQYCHGLEAKYLPAIRALISKDLSEPYSIYVYRYFLYQWGHLCFMVIPICSWMYTLDFPLTLNRP